jgi:cell wall-associated NlpC family hydrolase
VFVTLSNKGGRYTGNTAPMDKISVHLKRIGWVQVFTGYLDTVPFRQLYQGVITLKATCTIKRLLHTPFNPGLPASTALFNQMGMAAAVSGDGQVPRDSGLGSLLRELLVRVGGWDRSQIHISNFPVEFLTFLSAQVRANQAANQGAVERFRQMLLGDDISGGVGRYANYNSNAGAPGPMGKGAPFYVAQIMAAADEMGLGPSTLDLEQAQRQAQAAAEGAAGSGLNGDNKGWEGLGETATELRSATMNSDAAILGVACALGETQLRNLANHKIPESLRYDNDGVGSDHDSVGLFQQRNFAEWGTVAQRMNPRQAARMFFEHLARFDWRNTDPGQAIYRVQRGGSPSYFSGFIAQAKQLVTAAREAQQGVNSVASAVPLSGVVSSVAGAAGVDVGNTVNSVIKELTSMNSIEETRARLGKPNPDSEGAVMTALQQLGKPYSWGAKGPLSFDCSGLFYYAFRSIGLDIGGWTGDQFSRGQAVDASQLRRGDLIFTGHQGAAPGHVVMWMGDGTVLHAPTTGDVVKLVPLYFDLGSVRGIRRYADNGGPDPTAPRMNPIVAGPGMPPGTGTTTGLGGGTGGTSSEPIARNLFSYIFDPAMFVNETAALWGQAGGHKDFIDSQPLIQMVQTVCRASMRNFQSAPNGDFIAYYPDHFGLDGKPAILKLEDIELKNVSINWSDDQLATHVYVAGDTTMQGMMDQVLQWLDSAGTATVEDEWLFQRLRQVGIGDYQSVSGQDLMRRFGVRPYQHVASMAGSHELEFLLACQIFMEKWAAQYETQISLAFMPELFPGMRIQLGDKNLQVYVNEVVHDIDFEAGFSTSAVVSAPSNPNARERMSMVNTTATGPDPETRLTGENIF